MSASLESVRADVKFALTKQPGKEHAAIDGDGHTIYNLSFFAHRVPPAWLDEIAAKLYHEHELKGLTVKGVYALEFHWWVAHHIVQKVDPAFHFNDGYIGRGRQAQAIYEALADWVSAGDA